MSTARSGPNGNTRTDSDLRLMLIPSGPTPPNPPAILGADRTRELVEHLMGRFDIVLVDTPPLLPVSDAVPFLAQSDGVIIVARIGLTHRHSAQLVMEAAKRVPEAQILGIVANDLPTEVGYGYGYGYGYGDGYAATAKG
jgi:receptor protein-tyrosine kinase